MPHSYNRKILHVDLSSREITVEEPSVGFYRKYLGGWNFIAYYLLSRMPAGADPLGPDNLLVFANGVISGLPLQGTGRNAVGAKSPLTGGFGATEVGGFWGAELMKAGFDAIVIRGQAESPTYLWIKDGEVELRDATHLWGLTTGDALDSIRNELGDKNIRGALIGPGGENLVRYACITNDLKDFAGRCGLGAVMGSKKLKAIVVRGHSTLPLDNPEKIKELAKWLNSHMELAGTLHGLGTAAGQEAHYMAGNLPVHNFRDGLFPTYANLSAQTLRDSIGVGMEGCYACSVRCKKVVRATEPYTIDRKYGGPEYEPLVALGSNCGIDDLMTVAKANELCNAYTLDGISVGVCIAFAMECFEKGLLTLEDTDGLELRFGNAEVLLPLIEKIARREGIGSLLAEGVKRAAEKIGKGSEEFAMHVKGQEYPMHEPRLKRGLALGYATSPTGADHQHALHDTGFAHLPEPEMLSPLGIIEPVDLEDFGPAKVRFALYYTLSQLAGNCAVMCQFLPWNVNQIVDMIQAATGWNASLFEYMKAGERALTMSRIFNLREGLTANDDWLPKRSFFPPSNGPLATGVNADELANARSIYYGMMGWDEVTGIPSLVKLHELDISWCVAHLDGIESWKK